MPTATELLQSLEPLTHAQRWERCLAWGHASLRDPSLRSALDAMETGDTFARRCALASCFRSRDSARCLRAINDPSRLVRELAYKLVPLLASDHECLRALRHAFGFRRDKSLLFAMHHRRRQTVVDGHLAWLAAQPDLRDFCDLLPLGSPSAQRLHLARALERPSKAFWKRLLRKAPALYAEVLLDRITACPGELDAVTRQLLAAHETLCDAAAEPALSIAEALAKKGIQPEVGTLQALVRVEPERVLQLFVHTGLPLPDKAFSPVVGRLSESLLASVFQLNPLGLGLPELVYPRLTVTQRAFYTGLWKQHFRRAPKALLPVFFRWEPEPLRDEAFEAWLRAQSNTDGTVALALVATLPRDLRERAARWQLHDVSALVLRELERIPYAALLPWDEARQELQACLGHPEAEVRASAHTVLARSVAFAEEPANTAKLVLSFHVAKKNEQDPVRRQMLQGLAQWPRSAWSPALLPELATVLRAALDASDLSDLSARFAEQCLLQGLRVDPAWGEQWLETFLRERGQLYNYALGASLTKEELALVGPTLVRVGHTWTAQERWMPVIIMAESLGASIREVSDFAELLVALGRKTAFVPVKLSAALLLAKHFPATLATWLEPLLEEFKRRFAFAAILSLAESLPTPLPAPILSALCHIVTESWDFGFTEKALNQLFLRAPLTLDQHAPTWLAHDSSFIRCPTLQRYLTERRQELLDPFLVPVHGGGRFAEGKALWIAPFSSGFHRWTPRQNERFLQTLQLALTDAERDTPTLLEWLSRLPELVYARAKPWHQLAQDRREVLVDKSLRIAGRCDTPEALPVVLAALQDLRARIAVYGLRTVLKELAPARALEVLREIPRSKLTVAKEVLRLLGQLRHPEALHTALAWDTPTLHRDLRIALVRALWDHLEREESWVYFQRMLDRGDPVLLGKIAELPADYLTPRSDLRLAKLLAAVLERPEAPLRFALLQRAESLGLVDREGHLLVGICACLKASLDLEVQAAARALLLRCTERELSIAHEALVRGSKDSRNRVLLVGVFVAQDLCRRPVWKSLATGLLAELSRESHDAPHALRLAFALERVDGFVRTLEAIARSEAYGVDEFDCARGMLPALAPEDLERLLSSWSHAQEALLRRIALEALLALVARRDGWSHAHLESLSQFQADASPWLRFRARSQLPPRELCGATTKDSV